NAGSSSLKATVMESTDGAVVANATADWAGSPTRYQFTGPDGKERTEEFPWRSHANAVQRFAIDLQNAQISDIGAVGHRVVHGGQFTSSVRITPEIRSRIVKLADLAPL